LSTKDDSSDTISITSRVDPVQESLLLGGPKRLLAAGDKLRELIVPDVLASAVSVMGLGGNTTGKKKGLTAADPRDQNKVEKLRGELDALVAAGCPLCEVSRCLSCLTCANLFAGIGHHDRQAVHHRAG
jgi:hypothetical protein